MEDVLDVYKRPYDAKRPQVCLDETSKQLIGETRIPIPAAPGQEARYDHEYKRNGVVNLFMMFEPLAGKRHVRVTDRRTKRDWAECIREMVDEIYPAAERIVLVMDNLNTHTPASLYEAFPPDQAKHLADRLEIHYTPKHGSWLDMAEIELSVFTSQCLNRRIPDRESLERDTLAWERQRYQAGIPVKWRFTLQNARTTLLHLYPPTP
jgi:hypothetical protein